MLCFSLLFDIHFSQISSSFASLSIKIIQKSHKLSSRFQFSSTLLNSRMDLWSVHVKSTTGIAFPVRNSSSEKAIPWNSAKMVSYRAEDGRIFEIKVSRRKAKASADQSFVVRALGKKNNNNNSSNSSSPGNSDHSVPEGDGLKGNTENSKSKANGSQKPHQKPLDWREFRAILYEREQALTQQEGPTTEAKPLGLKWAHPLSSPETGCVLVATEKLDGVAAFERSVILLLRSGTHHPQEGPFGIVINHPLHKKIKHMKPTNPDLATTFAECSVHFGGPLEASMFLLRSASQNHPGRPGLEQVVPGLCYGARNNLDETAGLVKKGVLKPHDFRFFIGYAGWQFDQLREEIESDLWHVAACSPNLVLGGPEYENLWEEILQLMGGQYSDLSRKPKKDS